MLFLLELSVSWYNKEDLVTYEGVRGDGNAEGNGGGRRTLRAPVVLGDFLWEGARD